MMVKILHVLFTFALVTLPAFGEGQAASVIADDFNVLTIKSIDKESGHVDYDSWIPSKEEVKFAESNAKVKALVQDVRSRSEPYYLYDEVQQQKKAMPQKMDFINFRHSNSSLNFKFPSMKKQLTQRSSNGTRVQAIVELVIVLDKEFGDIFGHSRQRILDYWTVYMWDMNMRFRTLPSDAISFRVNAIVIIPNITGQPFIEQARGADGRAEFGRILNLYNSWVYRQMSSWPAFDLAPLVTNTALEWSGGLAYIGGACVVDNGGRRHYGTAVFNDRGDWGSLTIGAHEIGHNLGAPHDTDTNFPGGCSQRGYIMGGATDDLRWNFSSCSDRTISSFVRSSTASCLLRINGTTILDPGYANPAAPTMEEQCRRTFGPTATIEERDKGNCKSMRCIWPAVGGGGWWVSHRPPVDNTICSGGRRCFRGNCQ